MPVGLRSLVPSVAIVVLGAMWVGPAAQSTAPRLPQAAAPRAAVPCVPASDGGASDGAPQPTPTQPEPTQPTTETSPPIAPSTSGRAGSGLVFDQLPSAIAAPVGKPVTGQLRIASANIPNRTGDAGFRTSMRSLTASSPDFITLNEISRHTDASLRAPIAGYSVYRDPVKDRTTGGAMSMENAVMWRAKTWRLLDGGRVKIADDDRGYYRGRAYTWDRYATWATLQRADGAVASVISTHMMINPGVNPRQHGNPPMTRKQQFDLSMRILTALAQRLGAYGPVLVGGDMNSHPNQGSWTTAAHMVAAGFGYAKDRGVMYQFYPHGVTLSATRQLKVSSDHPALVSTLNMNGARGTGTTATAPRIVPTTGSSTRAAPRAATTPVMPSGEQLTAAQLTNASALISRGRTAKLPREAWVAAIAAALAESDLQNLAPSSGMVGLFRQRPSSGWGTTQRLSIPEGAADAFYGTAPTSRVRGLTDYPWRTMTTAEIDGAVLGTAFPEKYADRAADAQFVVQYLISGGATCAGTGLGSCPTAKGVSRSGKISAAARTVLDCAHRAFPQLKRFIGTGLGRYCEGDNLVSGIDIPLAARGARYMKAPVQATGARLAHFLQLHAADLGVNFIVFAGRTWAAADPAAGWRPYAASNGSHAKAALVYDRVYVAVKGGSC